MRSTPHRARDAIRRQLQRLRNRLGEVFPFLNSTQDDDLERTSLRPELRRRHVQLSNYNRRDAISATSSTSSVELKWQKLSERAGGTAAPVNISASVRQPSIIRQTVGQRRLRRQRSPHTVSSLDARFQGPMSSVSPPADSTRCRKTKDANYESDYEADEFGYFRHQESLKSWSEVSLTPPEEYQSDDIITRKKKQVTLYNTNSAGLNSNDSVTYTKNEKKSRQNSKILVQDVKTNDQNQIKRRFVSPPDPVPYPVKKRERTTNQPKTFFKNIFEKLWTSGLKDVHNFENDSPGIIAKKGFQPINMSRHKLIPEKSNFLLSLKGKSKRDISSLKVGVAFGFVIRKEKFERIKFLKRKHRDEMDGNDLIMKVTEEEPEDIQVITKTTSYPSEIPEEDKENGLDSTIWTVPIPGNFGIGMIRRKDFISDDTNDIKNLSTEIERNKLKFKKRSDVRVFRGQAGTIRRSRSRINSATSDAKLFYPTTRYTEQFAHLLPSAHNVDPKVEYLYPHHV